MTRLFVKLRLFSYPFNGFQFYIYIERSILYYVRYQTEEINYKRQYILFLFFFDKKNYKDKRCTASFFFFFEKKNPQKTIFFSPKPKDKIVPTFNH